MKKSTRKTINHLSQYIGHEIIRIKPACGNWSKTTEPILLLGFTPDGCIRYRYTDFNAVIMGNEEYVLPFSFTDRNWITYKKALRTKNNQLNQWKGKKIKRIIPTKRLGDSSFMCDSPFEKAPTLISASKYHIVIEHNDMGLEGRTSVLSPDFSIFSEWTLAE